jgi:hypothetical protein
MTVTAVTGCADLTKPSVEGLLPVIVNTHGKGIAWCRARHADSTQSSLPLVARQHISWSRGCRTAGQLAAGRIDPTAEDGLYPHDPVWE